MPHRQVLQLYMKSQVPDYEKTSVRNKKQTTQPQVLEV